MNRAPASRPATGIGVAIFVKTPGRSPIKTRLAVETGEDFALSWHRRAAAAVAAVARDSEQRAPVDTPIRAYWAVAEAAAIEEGDWPGLANLAQEEGSLGERMARVYAQLLDRHRAGILIGADTPQIDADLLLSAAAWLDSDLDRFAIGPARDGGFWLFGGNRPMPMAVWTGVAYSRADTERRLSEKLIELGAARRLPVLSDLDTAADLGPVIDELAALDHPLPEQRALANWLSRKPPSRITR